MSDDLEFRVEFHGPFLVATGTAASGMDAAPDRTDPVPATSWKGLMRAAVEEVLAAQGADVAIVDEVFGAPGSPSPWSWGRLAFDVPPVTLARARVRIDDDSGTADAGGLQLADEMWATSATFRVVRSGHVDPQRIEQHRAVLAVAGAAVHALGSDRRRGRGSVSVTVTSLDVGDALRTLTTEAQR